MKHLTRALIVIMALSLSALVYAAGGDTKKEIKVDGWKFMVRLQPIPMEARINLKATHHLSVTVVDPSGKGRMNGELIYAFSLKNQMVANGSAHYSTGKPMPCETQPTSTIRAIQECEHYETVRGSFESDVNLPTPGKYELNLAFRTEDIEVMAEGEIKIE